MPVDRGWLKGESLIDGSVDLAYVALCRDAILIKEENDRRVAEANQP